MLSLNLPEYPFNIIEKDGPKIWDEIRRRFVSLTPEEWVRQNFLRYLISEKGYPPTKIAIEQTLKVHKTLKRADAIVYNRQTMACMIIECKAAHVPLGEEVFDQIARYNIPLQMPWLVITNGISHYCLKFCMDTCRYGFADEIPDYSRL